MQDKFNMTVEDNIFIARKYIVDSIYKNANLEGIAITFPETFEIYEGRVVKGLSVNETIAVNNLKHGWQFILDTLDYPFDIGYIQQINKEIGKGIINDEGTLRDFNIKISGIRWKPEIPDYNKCKEEINQRLQIENTTQKAISIMLYLMRSQMFADGNKRTAQLAANQILIKNGAGVLSVPINGIEEFRKLLVSFYETDNEHNIKEFIYDKCIDGIIREKKIYQKRILIKAFFININQIKKVINLYYAIKRRYQKINTIN